MDIKMLEEKLSNLKKAEEQVKNAHAQIVGRIQCITELIDELKKEKKPEKEEKKVDAS